MGLTVSNGTKSLELTYAGFFRSRKDIAYSVDDDLGRHYETIIDGNRTPLEKREEFFRSFEEKLEELEESKNIDEDILSFLMASDCGGEINSRTAEKVLTAIKKIEGNHNYGYAAHPVSEGDVANLFAKATKKKKHGFIKWY